MKAIAYPKNEYVNVRTLPDVRSKDVTRLYAGHIATVSDETRGVWKRLEQPAGWVHTGFVRFEPLADLTPDTKTCDGFQPPVGTVDEWTIKLDVPNEWFNGWFDASPFGQRNYNGLHPGADLNKNTPTWDADKGMPLYAVASGQVITCGKFRVWGDLIVIKHDPLPTGQVVYSRYAHMDKVGVVTWQRVERGQQLGTIGNADTAEKPEGSMPYHLHFDVCVTDVLVNRPQHWPGFNSEELKRHYVNPKLWIETHHYLKFSGA